MSNIVAIVGRPNVGKSTLFNRLTQSRKAIVDSVSGVTRDRHYGNFDWNGKDFSVIDTGGYIHGSDDVFEGEIRKQVELALDECSAIFFVVDVEQGITDLDQTVAQLLRKTKKPVFLVVNKVDNAMRVNDAVEFYSLGLGEYYTISSINGSGTGELLDAVCETYEEVPEPQEDDLPKLAVIGRPNAGKSSFINALIGNERNIVTDIAGTTRDALMTRFSSFGFDFNLVDTAGLRKKAKVHENLEFYSVMRSVRVIENADVCLLMIDAVRGFEAQDLAIFSLAEKNKKGIIILVNKWDLVENKETNTMKKYEEMIREKISPSHYVPIIFVSATEKQRLLKALEMAIDIYKRKTTKITTSVLNETMLPIFEQTPPPANKGKFIRIKYCTQLPTVSPSFAFFANLPQYIKDPYRRFVENKLREKFDFEGVPITIYFRKK